MQAEKPHTLSVEEAATILGVSRSYAYELARNGRLPGVFQLGTRYRVFTSRLFEYMRAGSMGQHNPSC